jgi:site-specific recombinase XerD
MWGERQRKVLVLVRDTPHDVNVYQKSKSVWIAVGLVHSHMLRHSCGYKLANDGHDTRAIQQYLDHRSIASVRYTALPPDRFNGFWKD